MTSKKKFYPFLTFVLLFTLTNAYVHCEWNLKEGLANKEQINLELLQAPGFADLKKRVSRYIAGSWCTEEKSNLIMDLILLTEPKICVEIGPFTGSSFLPIAATLSFLQNGQAYAIDAWSNSAAIQGISQNDPNFGWWSAVNMSGVKNTFFKTMAAWNLASYYTSICERSSNIAFLFDRIDFLHLDGNFSEEGSVEDVHLYLPRVAPGGYILLSNAFAKVDGQYSKMKAIWMLLEECEIIAEIENSNTILFQKNP